MIVDRHCPGPTLGDKLGPYETVRVLVKATRGRDAPPASQEKRQLRLIDLNNRNRTKLTAFVWAALRRDRSDQGSSLCSTQPRTPSQTPPSSRYRHRLPRLPEAGSSNRTADRRACRSTGPCPSPDRAPH